MARFSVKKIFFLMSSAGIIGISEYAHAAAFQIWELDGATIGNYHAGYAANAQDASTAFYNPAGLVRIHNQQFVFGAVPVISNIQYSGTIDVNTLQNGPQTVSAQGGTFNLIPDLHYAAPLLNNLVFGLSVVVPFGLKTDYGYGQITRYAATKTALMVVDIAPSIGLGITDKLSVGAGLDAEQVSAEFDLVGTAFDTINDSKSINKGDGKGYGFHLGLLYQFNPQTRVGLSYHSQVDSTLKGSSTFIGNLANEANGGQQISNLLRTDVSLPAFTSLSLFHTFNAAWDVMATLSYIQWQVFNQIVLRNSAGVTSQEDGSMVMTNTLQVTVPEHYHNSWNYSVGANYHLNEKITLTSGLGYDQTPSNNAYRNLQGPDSDRIALAIGGQYQISKFINLAMGWTHLFVINTRLNVSQVMGSQITTTNGRVNTHADIFGLQLKWDIE